MDKNEDLSYLRGLARFPIENPNPVFRANNNCEVTYYNAAANNKLNINHPQTKIHEIIADFIIKEKNEVIAEKTIFINNSYYQITCLKINNGTESLFFAKDITELRKAIKEKIFAINRLETLIENLGNPVIIEDENRRIILINQQFCDTFAIPLKAKELIGADCSMLVNIIKDKFNKPDLFYERINYLINTRKITRSEKLETTNGRIFERDFIPVNDVETGLAIGNMWKYRDISDQQNLLQSIKKSEEKYRGMINNMNLGLIEVDKLENIIYCNKSFAETLNYRPEEIIGKNARKLFISNINDTKLLDEKLKARELEKSDLYEVELKDKYGNHLWMMISGAPLYNQFGDVIGSVGIHLNITDRKKMELELENARKNAIELLHAKERFLAVMSHEIRTPLNGIIGISQILESSMANKGQNQFIEALVSSSNTLLSLINDVLDFSKIEAGKFQIQNIEINIKDILKSVTQNFIAKIKEKGITLKIKYDNNIPSHLTGDSLRIKQVLSNLISNSIKFTLKGIIIISVKLIKEHDNIYKIRIIVEDTGIGMDPTTALSVFEQYTQGDASTASKFGGTGLGLNISLKLVELMGGNIFVSSEEGVGTTFCFYLNLEASKKGYLVSKKNMHPKKSLKNLRILVVDDNEINLLVAETMLRNAGALVDNAKTGIEALNKLKEFQPNIVLMDIQMPEMDGIEATKIMRNKLNIKIPIIGLTANTNTELVSHWKSTGFTEVISKPFKETELINFIYSISLNKVNTVFPNEENKNKELCSNQEFSLEEIEKLSKGNLKFINEFLGVAVDQLEEACNELRISIMSSDYKIAAEIMHKIKPTLAHFKANNLAEAASFLQIEANLSRETGETFLIKLEVLISLLKKEKSKFNLLS